LYNGEEYYWGVDPTPFCYSILPHLPTGHRPRLLEIGCGEGRDAVFFARCGCDVSAYDISSAGKRKTEQLAARAFVNVHAFVQT
jgi:tellurite methyltransferase